MANVRRLVQDLGKPYITFENTEARELGPDVCNDPSPSKAPKRTQLPGSWDGKAFDYSPLDSARQVIRLLYLHPGEGGDPIICSLREAELKSSEWPAYNALSYQWGDPTPTKPIHVLDGGIVDVRQNLYDALVQLRSRYEDKIFWIDAVCINQSDLSEKSHQIRLMGKIYAQATNVITWLGKASEDSDLAMDYLASYVALMGYPHPGMQIPEPSELQLVALHNLFKRGYWNRVWIIQEVARGGTQSYVFCGDKWVPWECVDWFRIEQERSGKVFLDGRLGQLAVSEHTARVLAASKFRELTRDGAAYPSLAELLRLSRGREAACEVDKVFGILGLSGDHIQEQIVPDYNKTLRDVLMEATKAALNELPRYDKMSLLCDAGHSEGGLPSWCPNWTKPGLHTGLQYAAYNASKGTLPDWRIDGSVLEIPVIIADRIADVSQHIFDGDNWEVLDDIELIAEGVIAVHSQGRIGPIPVREQNEEQTKTRKLGVLLSPRFTETFWRTLCADVDSEGRRPAPGDYGGFLSKFRERSEDRFKRSDPRYNQFSRLLGEAFKALEGRRFFVIERRFMGIGPPALREGDYICIVLGAKVPFILREDGGYFKIIGPAYIDGIMDGQVIGDGKEVMVSRIKIK
jgi:hypothetical protein